MFGHFYYLYKVSGPDMALLNVNHWYGKFYIFFQFNLSS